jgi:hypothetical protein
LKIIRSMEAHRARVAQLRALGYRVKTIRLPNGDLVTLTSKKRFVCRAHHCFSVRDPGGAPAVPWPPKKAKKAKKRKAAQ